MGSIDHIDFSSELRFETSRSSGPGGQHANKVETRVTLLFNVNDSGLITADQKARIKRKLFTRVTKAGILRVVAQKKRSQKANKALAIERFYELLSEALSARKKRVPTKASRAAKERIRQQKKQRSQKKADRRKDWRNLDPDM